ncbi:universal stress protein [Galbitalea sp. SE-J8]|uniref:universal stress protein n=1 Tax=Galbitalea sp. SE-J8 TaxID=3054952 RepID=UPI00259C9650|nr:universal stress protein [Galbitalea sp. SE-J8]MDM4761576.1 universal stress protein [Galbitalea sp. SE-J8]
MERITIGIDSERASDIALDWALARAASTPADLRLVSVPEHPLHGDQAVRARLAGLMVRVITASPESPCRADLLGAPIVDALADAGRDADLLVLGSHRTRPVRSALTGSIVTRVAASSATPTVVVPDDWTPGDGPVVVGYTDDETADDALAFAAGEALASGRELVVVHAWRVVPVDGRFESPREQSCADHAAMLAAAVARMTARFPGLRARAVLREGRPAAALLAEARDAALVVVGTHGYGPLAGAIVGSVGAEVMRGSTSPVCVVPFGYALTERLADRFTAPLAARL